ncbi:MAG: Y-family DNA polymerase [Eubacterium sp.]
MPYDISLLKNGRIYLCIDLKSFYASVECVERHLDPLKTNLAVADPERSEKTICLAISPSLKALGIKNRCRVFQIPAGVDYIMAPPRMKLYIEYSAKIYGIYLKYVAKEDIHVYSIDEAFLDVTDYLSLYHKDARSLAQMILQDILATTGITATCGIGTNLYLAKIALDIEAKHASDFIGCLDEQLYRQRLWRHRPLQDFWRIGPGIAKKLERVGIFTMKEITEADEDMLYHMFGIDAELLIDHAWGREPTTIYDIKHYRPQKNSISSGQVLPRDYSFYEGILIIKEMADLLTLDLVDKKLVTDSITLHVGYAKYNQLVPTPAHGSTNLGTMTSSSSRLIKEAEALYKRIVNPSRDIRRLTLTYNNVCEAIFLQYDLFTDPAKIEMETNMQKAILTIKKKYGKNAIIRGMNLEKHGTTIQRNKQIGGHKSD